LKKSADPRLVAIGLIWLTVLGAVNAPAQVSPDPVRFSIAIERGKVNPAQKTVRVMQGTALELEFTADETVELHLHGYDQLVTIEPGAPAVMRLVAKTAGRFAVAGHRFSGARPSRSHVVLFYLEVHPR
jgi:hypothetical protein